MDTYDDMMYASVVLWEIVSIVLLIEDLNNLDVFYANVKNVYLNAPPH